MSLSVERSDEQARENERRFREANEQIAAKRAELLSLDGATPYLCECEEPRCTEIVRLTLEEYRAVREHATRFFGVKGHPFRGELVSETERFVVVEK
jgi:hypothetical protein